MTNNKCTTGKTKITGYQKKQEWKQNVPSRLLTPSQGNKAEKCKTVQNMLEQNQSMSLYTVSERTTICMYLCLLYSTIFINFVLGKLVVMASRTWIYFWFILRVWNMTSHTSHFLEVQNLELWYWSSLQVKGGLHVTFVQFCIGHNL